MGMFSKGELVLLELLCSKFDLDVFGVLFVLFLIDLFSLLCDNLW